MIITILSDSPFIATGYSNQAKILADYLVRRGHQVHFLAHAYQGMTIKQSELLDGTKFNYSIYGMSKQVYFQDIMSKHLKETNTQVFIILLDTFMLYGNDGWFLNIDTSPAQTFFWYPSDGGGGMPIGCERILRKVECAVAMSKFGQKQVKDYYNLLTEYIPHGTEKNRFKKLSENERNEIKDKYGLKNKFVIGVVARNQPRKNLDRTLKMMQILNLIKDKIPNAVLFLHLDPFDPAAHFNMFSLVKRYNIENRVYFSGMDALKGFDWNKMNEIYNCMDLFVLTTSGEGFGIPIIEAMSCEVPVLSTDYTTTPELVIENKAGLGINLVGTDKLTMISPGGLLTMDSKEYDDLVTNGTLTGSWEVERGMCDIIDCAEKIVYLFENPDIRNQMGQNGRKAIEEIYDFETKIGPRWENLILNKMSYLNEIGKNPFIELSEPIFR